MKFIKFLVLLLKRHYPYKEEYKGKSHQHLLKGFQRIIKFLRGGFGYKMFQRMTILFRCNTNVDIGFLKYYFKNNTI